MEKLNRIKEVLFFHEKTQVWLAGKMELSTEMINAYCANRKQPSLKNLKRIADILEVDIRELLVPTRS